MTRIQSLILIAGLLALASAGCLSDEEAWDPGNRVRMTFEDVTVSADEIDATLGGEVSASGDVVLETPTSRLLCPQCTYDHRTGDFAASGGIELYHQTNGVPAVSIAAESIDGNRDTGDVSAHGNVSFYQGDERKLTGSSFTYNFLSGTGSASDAHSSVDGIYFHGETLKLEPGTYTIAGARFTTCDRVEDPHYYLSARRLVIRPGSSLAAHRVGLNLWGAQLFMVPQYRTSLTPQHRQPFKLPTVGGSKEYGFYAGYEFDVSRGEETVGGLDLSVSSKHSVFGGLFYDRVAGRPIYARLSHRHPYRGGERDDLLLSRLPEIGVRLCSGTDAQRLEASRHYATLAADTIEPLQPPSAEREVNSIAEFGLGRFRESPTDVTSNRADARVVGWLRPAAFDARIFYSPGIAGRVSHYDNGDTYASLAGRLAVARKLSDRSYVSLSYINTAVSGSTPFAFDAVELKEELAGKLALAWGEYSLELSGRYDIRGGRLFDSKISVGHRHHCLEPKISWSSRHRELSMDIGVVGF